MASAYFASLDTAEVIEVEFLSLQGNVRTLKLLVDTGSSGRSSVVLGPDAHELFRAMLPVAETTGALRGHQERAWVTCKIPGLNLQSTVIAIVADLTPLTLPIGVDGMVGLSFLRLFARWGAERTRHGSRFFLVDEEV